MITAFCVIMPLSILSGLATPIDNMPPWIKILTYGNPLRYALTLCRGVFLQDMPTVAALNTIWPMAIIGVITAAVAARMFRTRVA
jgi:ABC-2 type transport system permease protein